MMRLAKQFSFVMLGLLLAASTAPVVKAGEVTVDRKVVGSGIGHDERMKWWREARFGMFIHWNVSSVPAGVYHGKHNHFVGEWLMHDEKIPLTEYKSYASQFNPVKFNADEWVLLAKQAGMKYIVFTAKHHDGFAMYHSEVSDWNIVDATPCKRDILEELTTRPKRVGRPSRWYAAHDLLDLLGRDEDLAEALAHPALPNPLLQGEPRLVFVARVRVDHVVLHRHSQLRAPVSVIPPTRR